MRVNVLGTIKYMISILISSLPCFNYYIYKTYCTNKSEIWDFTGVGRDYL